MEQRVWKYTWRHARKNGKFNRNNSQRKNGDHVLKLLRTSNSTSKALKAVRAADRILSLWLHTTKRHSANSTMRHYCSARTVCELFCQVHWRSIQNHASQANLWKCGAVLRTQDRSKKKQFNRKSKKAKKLSIASFVKFNCSLARFSTMKLTALKNLN